MNKFSKVINDKILVLDWDGVIDLTADDKYATSLGKIDYRTTREYIEKLNEELTKADKSSTESFDDAYRRHAEKIKEHYSLKDKYLLERNDSKLMLRYHKSLKEIAKLIIAKDLHDEDFNELVEFLQEEFKKEDKVNIGRYIALYLRIRKDVVHDVNEMINASFPNENREELIDLMMELTLEELSNNPSKKEVEVYGAIPYRKIIRGIDKESEEQVRTLAHSNHYGLTIIGSHCNVRKEVFFKDKVIRNLFGKDNIVFIPIPFYPTILKDGLTEDEINKLRKELKAFNIDLDSEKGPTSKVDYIRYYMYKYKNMFINDNSQFTLIDNSSRNISDCNEKGGIGIYFKLGTTNPYEVGSLDLNEVLETEDNIINGRRK